MPNNLLPTAHLYHYVTSDGRMSGLKRVTEYSKEGNTYVVKDVNGSDEGVASVITQHVVFTNNEVLLTYLSVENGLAPNERRRFAKPVVLIRIPTGNETVSWINKATGEKFTSKFVTINENGENKIFLATYRRFESLIEAKYYFPGVGLWKTAALKDGQSTALLKMIY